MAHEKRRTASIPQEGASKTFRGQAEVSGNYLTRGALDKDDVDAQQVGVLIDELDGEIKTGASPLIRIKSSINFLTEGGGITAGDFLTVEGIDGFFKLTGVTESDGGTNNVALVDTTSVLVDSTTGFVFSNALTDASVADFTALGPGLIDTSVRPFDRIEIFTKKNIRQVFTITAVAAATLTLDGVPADDASIAYRISRPPQLPEFPLGTDGDTGLHFFVATGVVDGKGAPALVRYPGFGDNMLSRNINRGVRALSENTQYVKSVLEARMAVPRRAQFTSTGDTYAELTSSIDIGGIWTGAVDGIVSPGSAALSEFCRVVSVEGLDLEDAGGNPIQIQNILDASAGASLLNKGFVELRDVGTGTVFVTFTNTIVSGQDYVVIFGNARSIEDIVVDEPDAFMKGETVLTGINDEEIPEVSAARDSERLGTHTTLDERLESLEANDQFWFWSEDDPKFTFTSGGTPINHGAIKISWENTEYSVGASTIAISGTQGFIKASLENGAITLSSIDSATFDPDTLASGDGSVGNANEIIVGSWSTNDGTIQVLQGGHSETVVGRDSTRFGDHADLLTRLQDIESRTQFWYWQGQPDLHYVDNDASASGFSIQHGIRGSAGVLSIIYNNLNFAVSGSVLMDAVGNDGFVKASLENGVATLTSISATTIDATTLASGDGSAADPVEIIVAAWSKDPEPAKVITLHTGQQTIIDQQLSALQGNRLLEGDGSWFISTVSGATVTMSESAAIVDGRFVETANHDLTAANFAGGHGAGWSRVDIIVLNVLGVPSLIQGVETNSGPPAAPKTTARRPIIAELFLRSQASLVPLDIQDRNDGTNSFIRQAFDTQFAVNPEESVNHIHPGNLVRNGAFIEGPTAGPLTGWSLNNVTSLEKELASANRIFGDFSGKVTNGNSGSSYIFQQAGTIRPPTAGADFLGDINAYLGRWLTFSAYLKLNNKESTAAGAFVSIVTDVGSSDSFAFLDDQRFMRTSVSFFVPENATTLEVRISGDATSPSDAIWYVDGAMLTFGKHLVEFEHHPRMALDSDGVFRADIVDTGQPTGGANLLVFF